MGGMLSAMEICRAAPEDLERANALLSTASHSPIPRDFPMSDILVALEGSSVVGVMALEVRGLLGLIRAEAVAEGHPYQKVGSSLLQALVSRANELSLRELFLFSGALSEGAEGVFAEAGFASISRDSLPSEISSTREFRAQSPDTATVMRFQLATRFV